MKHRIIQFSFLIFIASLIACGGSASDAPAEGMRIKGSIAGGEDVQLLFDIVKMNKTTVLEKTTIDANGDFTMDIIDPLQPGIYRLRAGAQRAFLHLSGDEKVVQIEGDLANIKKYDFSISGSPTAEKMVANMAKMASGEIRGGDITKLVQSEDNALAAMHYAAALQPSLPNLTIMKNVTSKLQDQFPESDYTKMYGAQVGQIESQLARMQAQEKIKVGQPAPDISLPNPSGETMSLSDLKGQVVLLDFWASWCGPCRRANPHVVESYQKYKDRGFTVFSVSLDRPGQDARWKDAIAKDNLMWPYHVSDLKFWNSAPAGTYGVRGIPKTFLIDKDGKIASTSVSPYQLDAAIEGLL